MAQETPGELPQKGILVAFGQNWENYHLGFIRKKHGTERLLSKHSRRVVEATNELLKSGKYHTVIFTTGHTNGPRHIAEADAMANQFEATRSDGTHDVAVVRENRSFDTPSNIHETMNLLAQDGLQGPITVVAPHYHMERVLTTASGLGMPVAESFESEKVLGLHPAPTPIWEIVLRRMAKRDPEGAFPRKVWTKRRTRG